MRKLEVLALIAARAGSKGLADKNIRVVGGKPLLVRAVELARAVPRPRSEAWSVVVSTDSRRYAALADAAGAEVLERPKRLAKDETPLIDVVLHALQAFGERGRSVDLVVLLSATTPLTTPDDVRAAFKLRAKARGCSVVSVVAERVRPSWRFARRDGKLVTTSKRTVGRRQQEEPTLALNGAIYIAEPAWLERHGRFFVSGRTVPYIMPAERSLDIEDEDDLALAEWRLGRRK